MKTKILLIACFVTAAVQLFAQEKHYRTDQYIDRLQENEIDFTPIKGFAESQINVKDVRSVFIHTIPSNAYLALLSKNKQCMVVYSEPFSGVVVGRKYFEKQQTTRAQAKAAFIRSTFTKDLQHAYGTAKINDYLTVNSGEKVKKQFNADSVYIYEIPLNNEYLKPYTHGICIMTMRFRDTYLGMYLFLTDKGYKKTDKYLSKTDRSIFFRDTPKDPFGDLNDTRASFIPND